MSDDKKTLRQWAEISRNRAEEAIKSDYRCSPAEPRVNRLVMIIVEEMSKYIPRMTESDAHKCLAYIREKYQEDCEKFKNGVFSQKAADIIALSEEGKTLIKDLQAILGGDNPSTVTKLEWGDLWWDIKRWDLSKDQTISLTKPTACPEPELSDMVRNPKHYAVLADIEAIEIIARVMSVDQFKAYCLGNALKYRLRAGKKADPHEDLAKADFYGELFDKFKHLCSDKGI